ncbi:hypothetical protein [Thermomonospora umbrina]|uniref:PknH-like protein n=1 Tax=Thermomonospora umbrina TaxID=111806 RepID=A0A3D9SUY0_9ACTN|nr:hypothetical protein [Thermomonospora umbrina]REE99762.1 hypothetical protein DFJ69_5278 [Thermomonospora umbrina]
MRPHKGPPPKVFFGAAGGILAAVLAGVVVVAVASGGDEGGAAASEPASPVGRPVDSGRSPASYSSSPTTGAYAGIARRATDVKPLTEAESFPGSGEAIAVTEAKATLRLVDHRLDADCANAVWGAALGDELRRGGCTQALRGMYADARRGFALSVTILNLNTSADADRLVEALGNGRGGGFIRPLTDRVATPRSTSRTSSGASPTALPLERFGEGFSMARGLAMGHYAVIAWAQRLDGSGDAGDEALLALLIEGGKAPGVLGRAAAAG